MWHDQVRAGDLVCACLLPLGGGWDEVGGAGVKESWKDRLCGEFRQAEVFLEWDSSSSLP